MQFDLAPMLKYFTLADCIDLGLRIILPAICGAIIGLERERRYKNAGLRTHIIVAIAASILMIVSKYGFLDIASIPDVRLTSDGGRIAAGVIQSIGFLGAGVIFVRRENIIGLTTAAGLWATVGIGLCFGAGMYVLGISTTLIIVLVNILLRIHHQKRPFQTIGIVILMNTARIGATISASAAIPSAMISLYVAVKPSLSVTTSPPHFPAMIALRRIPARTITMK